MEQQRGLTCVSCELHEQRVLVDEHTEGVVLEQGAAGSRRAYRVEDCCCRGTVRGESGAFVISCTMPIVGSFSFLIVAMPVTAWSCVLAGEILPKISMNSTYSTHDGLRRRDGVPTLGSRPYSPVLESAVTV